MSESEARDPEALLYTADGEPAFAALPGELVDEEGRPCRQSPHWEHEWYREEVRKAEANAS